MTIGKRIKALRNEMNLSQNELSIRLDLKQSTVANYEKDTRKPNLDILVALADVFNVTIDELIGYTHYPHFLSTSRESIVPLADRFLQLLLDKRVNEAKRTVDDFLKKSSLENVFFKLFRVALTKLGWLWEIEEITISDEHYVSYEITKMINQLSDEIISRKKIETKSKKIVGMAVPGEKHNIGLKMMLAVLETKGYQTRYIGDAVPLTDLKQFLETETPDVLILSVTSVHFHQRTYDLIEALPDEMIAVAGLGVEGLTINHQNVIGYYKKYDTCMEALL